MNGRRKFEAQFIAPDSDGKSHWRIADPSDCRVATCHQEHHARMIVRALNQAAASAQADQIAQLEAKAESLVLSFAIEWYRTPEDDDVNGIAATLALHEACAALCQYREKYPVPVAVPNE